MEFTDKEKLCLEVMLVRAIQEAVDQAFGDQDPAAWGAVIYLKALHRKVLGREYQKVIDITAKEVVDVTPKPKRKQLHE